jgi:hypothetical protein
MPARLPCVQMGRTPPTNPPVSETASSRGTARPTVAERLRAFNARSLSGQPCDFCSFDIDNSHRHLFDRVRRSLVCVCQSCYGLFTHDGAGGMRFRAVPHRYVLLPNLVHVTELWDALQIPIGPTFLFTNSATGLTIAYRPGPSEATEAALPLDVWQAVERAVPAVATMAHDVEALLIRRTDTLIDAVIAPIDACFELLGRIRRDWCRGQSDNAIPREIDAFITQVSKLTTAPTG